MSQLLGTQVLLSAAALEGTTGVPTRDVGTFLLRGKRLSVRVLEPLAASRCELDDEALAEFANALTAFRAGAWADAHERFAALVARFPQDGPSGYYDALVRGWLWDPPPNWTGAVRVTAK